MVNEKKQIQFQEEQKELLELKEFKDRLLIDYQKKPGIKLRGKSVEEWINETNKKIKLVWGNFADIEKIAAREKFVPVDGILFDLGLSMEQIAKSGRGFSIKNSLEPLDMRISKKAIKKTEMIED